MVSPPSSLASLGEIHSPKFSVKSTAEGLIVEWNAPDPRIDLESGGSSIVRIPDFTQTTQRQYAHGIRVKGGEGF